ncbi:uncharacterized protein LOC128666758 isoform X4 [Bombina bombina]|uniref:uncharacterized protein LOC128666758 isoform X4 n=1 Tax=Bombina bombina TaxID=8345 RepID=UPI00235A90DF|nr:uncharacterized protein LOC128666758 isoform X4 [Bombina bombina]
MSDKTENQTSDLPDIHRGCLEENAGPELLDVKEEDETDDMNSQTEIHSSLPADEDDADIVKVEITEDLCLRHQLGARDDENSDSISSGRMDVTPSDGSAVEHGGEPYVCDQVKTEEDEVPINTSTDSKIAVILKTRVQMLRILKKKEIMPKTYVPNIRNVLPRKKVLLQMRKHFHVLNVGNVLI